MIERATISAVKLNGGKTFTNIVAGEERNQGMMFKAGDTLSLSFSISNLTDTPKSMLLYGTTERMGSLGNKESSGLYITFVFSNGQWILDPSDYWNQNGFPDCLKKDSVKLSNSGNSYTFSGLVQDGELDRIDLHYISIDTENTSVNLTLNTVTEDRVIPILIFNDNCYKGKHTYYSDSVKTTDVNPTNDKPGSKSIKCVICGAIVPETVETIPAYSNSNTNTNSNSSNSNTQPTNTTNTKPSSQSSGNKAGTSTTTYVTNSAEADRAAAAANSAAADRAAAAADRAAAENAADRAIKATKTPRNVKAKAKKKGKVIVTWAADAALLDLIDRVQVQFSTSPEFSVKVGSVKVGRNDTKAVLYLEKGKTYYIRVRYTGNDYTSGWSSVKKVKTK